MIFFEDALRLVSEAAHSRRHETVSLRQAAERVLAAPIVAPRTAPPQNLSAMDGFAVRLEDIKKSRQKFQVVGEAAAGAPFDGVVGKGQAVRIFTGAAVPQGATHVVIQEEVTRVGDTITLTKKTQKTDKTNIRVGGADFYKGDVLLAAGEKLTPEKMIFLGAANVGEIEVFCRPRVALLATGDELVAPGFLPLDDTKIPDSISAALAAKVSAWGGLCVSHDILPDDPKIFAAAVEKLTADAVDIIVPIGGASVGDYDISRQVFAAADFTPVFDKIAIKPGKPCWFSRYTDGRYVLGLPGNPGSAWVTAALFLRPLIAALEGSKKSEADFVKATLTKNLAATGDRASFSRARYDIDAGGRVQATPFDAQDSSLTRILATTDCLIYRPPHTPPAKQGDIVDILFL